MSGKHQKIVTSQSRRLRASYKCLNRGNRGEERQNNSKDQAARTAGVRSVMFAGICGGRVGHEADDSAAYRTAMKATTMMKLIRLR